jgi:hypothetical protein
MVLTGATWRTSTYSGSNGGECVEVATRSGRVLIRDTKNRNGSVLQVSPAAWRTFASRVKDTTRAS